MSEEELDIELERHPDEGLVTIAKLCIQNYKVCRRLISGKSFKSRKKAIARYPQLEDCPLDKIADTRENMSRIMEKQSLRSIFIF